MGAAGNFQVQLLAGRDESEVKDAWSKLKAKNPDLLGPLSPTLARAELGDRGTFYRLRAGP
ncbi:MAG: SPOR domain-containing protein [Rhodospirillales bacterium]